MRGEKKSKAIFYDLIYKKIISTNEANLLILILRFLPRLMLPELKTDSLSLYIAQIKN